MKPILRLRKLASSDGRRRVISTPSSRYEPLVGRSRQPMRFMKVDLPEPEGPMMATNSPLRTSRLMARSACTTLAARWYSLVSSVTAITAGGCSRVGVVTARLPHPELLRRDGLHRHRHRPRGV